MEQYIQLNLNISSTSLSISSSCSYYRYHFHLFFSIVGIIIVIITNMNCRKKTTWLKMEGRAVMVLMIELIVLMILLLLIVLSIIILSTDLLSFNNNLLLFSYIMSHYFFGHNLILSIHFIYTIVSRTISIFIINFVFFCAWYTINIITYCYYYCSICFFPLIVIRIIGIITSIMGSSIFNFVV